MAAGLIGRKGARRRRHEATWRAAGRAALLLACSAGAAHAAEVLPDPTRPPAALAAEPEAGSAAKEPVLQSVVLSGARRAAVISGELVTVGARVGDARVVRIAETEVVLRREGRNFTLKLFPGVVKSPAGGQPRASAGGHARRNPNEEAR